MKTPRTSILESARTAAEHAATVDYDALTPETARALLKRGSDVVPDYAEEAARVIVAAAFGLDSADVRGTRLVALVTEAWSRAYLAAWPAEDVAALAAT